MDRRWPKGVTRIAASVAFRTRTGRGRKSWEGIILYVIGAVLTFGIGIYIGLGAPGIPGRGDRVVSENLPRRRHHKIRYLDWLRPPDQPRT